MSFFIENLIKYSLFQAVFRLFIPFTSQVRKSLKWLFGGLYKPNLVNIDQQLATVYFLLHLKSTTYKFALIGLFLATYMVRM